MSDFFDRDYSEEFSITLEWREWNIISSLVHGGFYNKDYDEWTEEEFERDNEARERFLEELHNNSPGNGMDDWPDSMKKAYDKAVWETYQQLREEERDG